MTELERVALLMSPLSAAETARREALLRPYVAAPERKTAKP